MYDGSDANKQHVSNDLHPSNGLSNGFNDGSNKPQSARLVPAEEEHLVRILSTYLLETWFSKADSTHLNRRLTGCAGQQVERDRSSERGGIPRRLWRTFPRQRVSLPNQQEHQLRSQTWWHGATHGAKCGRPSGRQRRGGSFSMGGTKIERFSSGAWEDACPRTATWFNTYGYP
jgi:hypothetical protein